MVHQLECSRSAYPVVRQALLWEQVVITGLGTQGLPSCGSNRETSLIPVVYSLSHTTEKRLGCRLPFSPDPVPGPSCLPGWLLALALTPKGATGKQEMLPHAMPAPGAINSPQAERHPSSGLAVPTSYRKGGGHGTLSTMGLAAGKMSLGRDP